MSVLLAGYEFQGPYSTTDSIVDQRGLYAILCVASNMPPRVLDIGTAGEGMHADSQGVLRRLKSHGRKACWERYCQGRLMYAVRYEQDTGVRLNIEDELRWKLDPPCGANPWDISEPTVSPAAMEQRYGPRGAGTVVIEAKSSLHSRYPNRCQALVH